MSTNQSRYTLEKYPPKGSKIAPCPVCGSQSELWRYSESKDSPSNPVVMCTHTDKIGPQDSLLTGGCFMSNPTDDFYKATIREAIEYWNSYAKALVNLRNSNEATK